jgi:hypothetical protein
VEKNIRNAAGKKRNRLTLNKNKVFSANQFSKKIIQYVSHFFFFIISILLGIHHIILEVIPLTWSSEKLEKPFFLE